nr:ribonuclease H-like domain-containing protein [Tanacetum cinerariifolium]
MVEGVDVDETFSLVVKLGTIRTVFSLAISRYCPVHQLDVKNTFLHGDLAETVYMHQPLSFRDPDHPNYVCLLQRSLYGLKQAPRAWFSEILASLHHEFSMTDLGALNYFFGISVTRDSSGMFLSQLVDPTLYWSLVGSLQYLTFTGPDITYAVQQAGCPTTRRSTSGYCVFLGNNLVSCSSKRQLTLSHSSAEAEYRGVANVVAETCWIQNLLCELHTPLYSATIVYYDNVSDVYLSSNPVQHKRTKHIEIDIHFVRDLVATGQVRVLHVPSRFQYAYIFNKGLPSALFDEFRDSLSVRCTPAPTAGKHVDPNTKMVVIWNPAVRKSMGIDILVPKGMYIKEEWIVVGFGVCPDTSDLKLVKIIDDKISSMWVVEVFTLSTHVWKTVYKGAPFKLCDLTLFQSEKFGEVCLPEILVHTPNLNVTKVNESLGLLECYDKGDMKVCGVWSRKDDANNQFTKIYTIKVEGKWLFNWVLGFRSFGEVVIELDDDNYKDSRIAIYEPLSGHINDVGINGDLCTLYAWSYMETLLLLDEADSIIL